MINGWLKFVFILKNPKKIWEFKIKKIGIKNFQLLINKLSLDIENTILDSTEIKTGIANNLCQYYQLMYFLYLKIIYS